MLYSPRWDRNLSLDSFLAWVEQQNPAGRYVYRHKGRCAVGCWLKALGRYDELANWRDFHIVFQLDQIAQCRPHSYGALAARLRRRGTRPF
jgi:hypothetical protein